MTNTRNFPSHPQFLDCSRSIDKKNVSIKKTDLQGLLEKLSAHRTLVGPVDTGKVVEFRPATTSEILTDDRVSYKSMKEFYFPQVERMFTFADGEVADNTQIPSHLIFGARPCDLEGLRVMSKVFMDGKYVDSFFQRRYEANFIIGVGCLKEKVGCFCGQLGIDREFSDFCDMMLVDAGESYIIKHLSEKGKEALSQHSLQLDLEELSHSKTPLPNPLKGDKIAFNLEISDRTYFDVIDWEKAVETCLGCGLCSFICPTCHCFDFKDVQDKGQVNRYKCWDSCIYPKFTLHASGHNPREQLWERYRQRVLHKFKYVPTNVELTACTGCGRCIRSCPVGMNIEAIAKEIVKQASMEV